MRSIHKIPSAFSSITATEKWLRIEFLMSMPTPPDPLMALLEIFLLLFPNHLYPFKWISFSLVRKVSAIHIMSSLDVVITLLFSCCDGSRLQPQTFQKPTESWKGKSVFWRGVALGRGWKGGDSVDYHRVDGWGYLVQERGWKCGRIQSYDQNLSYYYCPYYPS